MLYHHTLNWIHYFLTRCFFLFCNLNVTSSTLNWIYCFLTWMRRCPCLLRLPGWLRNNGQTSGSIWTFPWSLLPTARGQASFPLWINLLWVMRVIITIGPDLRQRSYRQVGQGFPVSQVEGMLLCLLSSLFLFWKWRIKLLVAKSKFVISWGLRPLLFSL